MRPVFKSFVFNILLSTVFTATYAQGLIIGHNQAHLEDLKSVPLEWIDSAKAKLQIAYWRTSHGGQVLSGMNVLDAFMGGNGIYKREAEKNEGSLYVQSIFGDLSDGEDSWPQTTRDFLDDPANQEINVVMWAWCQILGHDGDQDPGYTSKMEGLISEYGPGGTKIASGERKVPVQFVFMTGHLNGQGEEGPTNKINTYIRNHCIANNRILYDFADIESYDPDDNYFLDDFCDDGCNYLVNGDRTGNWAEEWVVGKVKMDGEDDVAHNEPNGGQWFQSSAEHSHALNANMKAYAAWYMFARMAGWKKLVTSIEIQAAGGSTEISVHQGTLQMSANVSPEDASDTTITWSVNNGTGQATISPDGLLLAVSDGTVWAVAGANDGSGIKDSLQISISNQSTATSTFSRPAKLEQIKVYPNPSSDYVQVMGDMEYPAAMRIYNMTGRLIREVKLESGEQQIDISGLQEGLFIIRLSGKKDSRTVSFIKK
jgi:hypothetical protein